MSIITTPSATRSMKTMENGDGAHAPQDGDDVGGIPTTLQHGLFEDEANGHGAPAVGPVDADWPDQEAAAKGDHDPATQRPAPSAERREPGHIDSALESLGEAISEPVREAAEEMSDQTGGQDARETKEKRP